jgi:hypothetical protein
MDYTMRVDCKMGQKYGSFLYKYKFTGVRGEDREAIGKNWPFKAPPLNCVEDKKVKRGRRVK